MGKHLNTRGRDKDIVLVPVKLMSKCAIISKTECPGFIEKQLSWNEKLKINIRGMVKSLKPMYSTEINVFL